MEFSHTAKEKHLHASFGFRLLQLTITKISESQSPLVCLLVSVQLINAGNDFLCWWRKMVLIRQCEIPQKNGLILINKQNRGWNRSFIPVKRCNAYGESSLWIAWTAHNDLQRLKIKSRIRNLELNSVAWQRPSSHRQYGQESHSNAWLANIAEFSEFGANRFPLFKPIKHVDERYWHSRRIFRTSRQPISTFSISFKRYARSFVQYVINRVISSNEVLKVLLNVGRKSPTATEITFLIIYYYLLKISLLKNLGLKT